MYICLFLHKNKVMTIQNVKIEFQSKLTNIYTTKEIQSICFLFLEHIGFSKTDCIITPHHKLSAEQITIYTNVISRLQRNEPIQYILGHADFYGLQFAVNPSVLIPRQETNLLVQMIISEHQQKPSPRILDACTGSGCIAISIAKNMENASVSAFDISKKALETAYINAQNNNTSISFYELDILDTQAHSKLDTYDILVSNPPYVRQCEKQNMHANVLAFEPEIALFVEDSNPLIFYEALAHLGQKVLPSGGDLYCEINEELGTKTCAVFKNAGYDVCSIHKDLHGKNRFIHTIKK